MGEPVSHSEDKDAVENCIRSFIIKSIHAIVQARSGNACTTECISDVGARNNLMVYIEEDPEIGANIKQTLSAGFPINVRDILAVEILAKTPAGDCVHEVWRFRLDIDERLNELTPTGQTVESRPAVHGAGDTSLQASTEVVVGDFKPARLFQQLGTLLKSIIVVTRLLPAYRISRGQVPTDYPMFYTLRRGFTDLSRLGPEASCHEIGRLFSGLAVKQQQATGSPTASQPVRPLGDLLPVFLQACVCRRTSFSQREVLTTPVKVKHTCRLSHAHSKSGESRVPASADAPLRYPTEIDNNYQLPGGLPCHQKNVRAVFGDPHEPQELIDPAHQLLTAATAVQLADYSSDSNDEELAGDLQHRHCHPLAKDLLQLPEDETGQEEEDYTENSAWPLANGYGAFDSTGENMQDLKASRRLIDGDHHQTQGFAFSLLETNGERPTRLLAQIRETANLDLFKAPRSLSAGRASQSSLFDADALTEELERHERRLKEFDDFLADFVSLEPFAAQPNLTTRGRFTTEP